MPVSKFSQEVLVDFEITEPLVGLRIDKALATHSEISSRSQASRLLSLQRVSLNGTPVKASHMTKLGEKFLLRIPKGAKASLAPLNIPLKIVFEDQHLIVVDKPSGLVVHPAHGHTDDTLVNALVFHCKDLSMGFSEFRPGIVHRLDKDTSGLLVAAKTDKVHEELALQFRNRTVIRRYKALCYGTPKERAGTIKSTLIRHPVDRKKFCSEKKVGSKPSKGKVAITNYAVSPLTNSFVSLIYCKLETGRTHQIRVHLAELGHPIVNDAIYCRPSRPNSLSSVKLRTIIKTVGRLGLHAFELGFVHPVTQQNLYFHSAWPDDLKPLVDNLGFTDA